MKKIVNIKDDLSVKEVKKGKRSIISVIDGNNEILLSDIKTDDYFWHKWIYDDNYIVTYSRGCMMNQIPLNIEAAYSINNKRLLDLSNKKIKVLLEYMLISKKGFDLANVLSEINSSDLGLLDEDEKEDLSIYLTSGNMDISKDQIISYILNRYPQLKKYTELEGKLSVTEYRKIIDELADTFYFHMMSQDLNFLGTDRDELKRPNTDFKQVYISEYEQQQRVLSLKK